MPSRPCCDAISPKARLRCRSTSPRGAIIDECSPSSRSHAARVRSRATCRAGRHRRVKAGLLRECLPVEDFQQPARLAAAIKALPLRLVASRPIDEAISTAGGVRFEGLDGGQMIAALPGVFCAGEMLDWEAPTGGYLLTACLASGRVAGAAVLDWLRGQDGIQM